MKRRVRRQGGFTLLELLLVVGILALLAAFVLPNLIGARDEASVALAQTAVGRNGSIASALKKYRFDVGVFPTTDEGLAALYEKPGSIEEEENQKIWKGPYMEGTPEELRDPWKHEYQYRSPGEFNEDSFDLWSLGPKDGDEDDIKNWREK